MCRSPAEQANSHQEQYGANKATEEPDPCDQFTKRTASLRKKGERIHNWMHGRDRVNLNLNHRDHYLRSQRPYDQRQD